ncbi:MAG TPA: hypothetical protein DCW29_24100 [Janthinobacterium sp.]|nr:hypothetical protein [Janthinobacterium sp.]
MKRRQWIMAAALAGAAALAYFGDKSPAGALAEAVVRVAPARAKPAAPTSTAAEADPPILNLRERAQLIGEGGEFGAGQAVFLSQNWTPPPPKPGPAPPPPPPAPVAPPLPFTYIGKAAGDGSWEVFLARADQTYIVRNKTVIDGLYRVDAIAPPLMTLTYLPLNQVQQINIGVLD